MARRAAFAASAIGFSAMGTSLGTRLFTWLRGELVGIDQFGNRYYRDKYHRPLQHGAGRESRERRWVIYNGEPEASRVPPVWHGWLHYTFDEVPKDAGKKQFPWQKDYLPNLTGTPFAYRPPGSVLRGGHRAAAVGDYEPWKPE
jgi:NADH:ubiquinone oxidoreductase subunit